MRPCPACGRRIQDAAPRCHYCHAPVPQVRRADRVQPLPTTRSPEALSQSRPGLAFVIALVVVALVVGALLMLLG